MILVIPQILFFHLRKPSIKNVKKYVELRNAWRECVILRFTNLNLEFILKLGKIKLKIFLFPNSGEMDPFLVKSWKKPGLDKTDLIMLFPLFYGINVKNTNILL